MKAIAQILILLFSFQHLSAQVPETAVQAEIEEEEFNIPFEKIYLHTDKSHYFSNDTVWLKAYAKTLPNESKLMEGHSEALYVYLSKADDSEVLKKSIVRMEKGSGTANLVLTDLESGDYLLSAYTDLMRLWAEDYIFQKPITIQEPGRLVTKNDQKEKVKISFHPESDLLIPEVKNRAVVMAKNGSGFPASSFQGYLMNNRSDTLSPIQIDKKGMSMLEFVPKANDTYHILGRGSDGNWEKHDLPNFSQQGVLIQTDFHSDPNKLFITLVKSPEIQHQKFQMVALSSGKPVYELIFDMKESQQSMSLDKENFMPGIFNIAVLDDSGKILGERHVYLHPGALPKIEFASQKQQFSPREKVQLGLEVMDEFDEGLETELSVSVVDLNQVSQLENPNINSHFALLAYLTGDAQNFLPRFLEEETDLGKSLDMMLMAFPVRNALSKVMALKETGSNFSIPVGFNQKIQVLDDNGVTLTKAKELEVLVYPFQGSPEVFDLKTDSKGIFDLAGMYFQDSARVMVTELIENKRGRTEKLTLSAERLRMVEDEIPISTTRSQYEISQSTSDTYLNDVKRYRKIREADTDSRDFLLDTVNVENIRERFGISDRTSFYGGDADIVLKVPDKGYEQMNVFQYMRGRVAGMTMEGDVNNFANPPMVFFRQNIQKGGFANGLNQESGISGALFLLDGVITERANIGPILMPDIERIEILNTVASSSVYGHRGGLGVVNIITKRVDARLNAPSPDQSILIPGFSRTFSFREIAEGQPIKDPFKNNLKSTVYWNPYVETDFEGKGEIEFTLSDAASEFLIVVEGMSKEGEPIYGTYQIRTQ